MPQGKVFDLGRQGDGLIRTDDGRAVFVAGALAGETVEYETADAGRARLVRVIAPSPDRVEPVCPCFAQCGGCALQHLKKEAYRAFKLRCLRELLPASWNLPDFDEPFFAPFESRRRATFAVMWNGPVRRFGFNARQSDRIVETADCPALVPALRRLIVPLREYVADRSFPKKKGVGDVSVQMTGAGADILFTLPFEPSADWRSTAADFAANVGAARVSWRTSEREEAEPLAVLSAPELRIGDFILKPPAGVFLQPSQAGQDALTAAVVEYVGKAKRVYDLFCGAGTFTLPLLQKKRVIKGADNAPQALAALRAASDGRVETSVRDLFKMPMYPDELYGIDAVVFDPPRAGAKAQCEQLAASEVPRVVAVSCNPVSFVRDAEILMRGGYELKRLRPVDQFVFTPHMELAALFEKKV